MIDPQAKLESQRLADEKLRLLRELAERRAREQRGGEAARG